MEKIDKLYLIKIRNICASKDTIKEVKIQPTVGENTCKLYIEAEYTGYKKNSYNKRLIQIRDRQRI